LEPARQVTSLVTNIARLTPPRTGPSDRARDG